MYLIFQIVDQFCLINFKIAADKYDHIGVIQIFLVYNCLTGIAGFIPEKFTDILDRMNVRRMHFFKFCGHCISCYIRDIFCRFHICAEITFITQHDRILTDRGKKHELMGKASTHHTGI